MAEHCGEGRFQSQENFWQGSSNNPFANSSNTSLDTVHHTRKRDMSLNSVGTQGSYTLGPLRIRNGNILISETSFSTLNFAESPGKASSTRQVSKQISHKSSWANEIPVTPQYGGASDLLVHAVPLEETNLDAGNGESKKNQDCEQDTARNLSFEANAERLSTRQFVTQSTPARETRKPPIVITDTTGRPAHPFRRWMSTIRRKNPKIKTLTPRHDRWSLDDFDKREPVKPLQQSEDFKHRKANRHQKTSSWSSSGFVTAVKSATVSLGPLSLAHQSRKTRRSNLLRGSNRSSGLSDGVNRASMDSSQCSAQMIDEAAWDRAIQRRRTLEELVSSEESYIADLKVLINVYFTLIASASNEFQRKSPQIHRNINEILALHEDLLLQIRSVMPDSELTSDHDGINLPRYKHTRWHSVESPSTATGAGTRLVARRSIEASWFGRSKLGVLVAEPREVAEVARVFSQLIGRFFVYEEYGAKYESMLLDMTSASKSIPHWHVYERGIEALAHSLASTSTRALSSKKGLTFEDLLIKPIQRICKYPLLFADLERNTPVIDGPDSRAEIAKVSCRLRETAFEINKATNDQETRSRIQRSWYLQDLLILPDASTAPPSLRILGHANLCGVLYVAYQSKSDLRGDYMLCVLFKSYLLLATPKRGSSRYNVMAIMSLVDIQIDSPDNGRGLQCHTAPYSWKLIFESDQQLYELILCACSAREEEQWKANLFNFSAKEARMQREDTPTLPPLFSILSLDIRSLGYVFGLPGTLTRRISIQRAATVSPRTNVCQVIIKNTNALKDYSDTHNSTPNSISRSQSLLSTNRVLVLAPKRVERLRMEYTLTDVWTRDLLPYPGMSPNRGEHLIRTSASSMMRKLSRASIASSFTKRSASIASLVDDKMPFGPDDIEPIIEMDTPEAPRTFLRCYPSSLSRQKDGASTGHCIEPPPRTSSAKGMMFSKGRKSVKIRQGSGLVKKAVSCEEVSKLTSQHRTSSKRNSPGIHLKTFSADGIKHWFSKNDLRSL